LGFFTSEENVTYVSPNSLIESFNFLYDNYVASSFDVAISYYGFETGDLKSNCL